MLVSVFERIKLSFLLRQPIWSFFLLCRTVKMVTWDCQPCMVRRNVSVVQTLFLDNSSNSEQTAHTTCVFIFQNISMSIPRKRFFFPWLTIYHRTKVSRRYLNSLWKKTLHMTWCSQMINPLSTWSFCFSWLLTTVKAMETVFREDGVLPLLKLNSSSIPDFDSMKSCLSRTHAKHCVEHALSCNVNDTNSIFPLVVSAYHRTGNYWISLILNHYNLNLYLIIGRSHQINQHQRW